METEKCNIKVVVRVRPHKNSDLQLGKKTTLQLLDENTLLFDPESEEDDFFDHEAKYQKSSFTNRSPKALSISFDRVFGAHVDNVQIFDECTASLVDKLLCGYNCSVFAYGATGSGKTFTMLGTDTCPGLTPLTISYLFQKMEEQKHERSFEVGVSYLEVYNEQVCNLLTKSAPLQLRESAGGVRIHGLNLELVENFTELLELLLLGNANRRQHPTDVNSKSSRSHAIFQLHMRITERATQLKRLVKLSMIDLAGNERANQTKEIGERFKEGAQINKSLLALANCITKLSRGEKHIPYRDSNLTRILKDSLGGNCYTLMVANVSMSVGSYEDTYNTLRYAKCATRIPSNLKKNILTSRKSRKYYMEKCAQLEAENQELKTIIAANSQSQATASASSGDIDVVALEAWIQKLDAAYLRFITVLEKVGSLESTIKILNLRQDFGVESDELCSKLFPGSDKNLPPFQIYNQHVREIEHELAFMLEKLFQAHKELMIVKQEANNSGNIPVLGLYQKYQESLMTNSKQYVEMQHTFAVNYEYMVNSRRLQKTLKTSLELNHKSHIRATFKLLYHSHDYQQLLSDLKSNHVLHNAHPTNLERNVDELLQLATLTTMHTSYGFQESNAYEQDCNPLVDTEDTETLSSSSHQDGLEESEEELSSLSKDFSASSGVSNATYIIERHCEIVGDAGEVLLNDYFPNNPMWPQ